MCLLTQILFFAGGYGKKGQKELSCQMQQWQEEMNIRLSGRKVPPKYWESPELEKGNIHKHCAYCIDLNCSKSLNIESLFDSDDENMDSCTSYSSSSCGMISCNWNCGVRYHACKSTEHRLICPMYEEPGEFDWIARGVGSHGNNLEDLEAKQHDTIKNSVVAKRQKNKKSKASRGDHQLKEIKSKSIGDLFLGPPKPANQKQFQRGEKNALPTLPKSFMNDVNHIKGSLNLSLSTSLELQATSQTKPIHMYTFVCGKSFRRDEYNDHVKNVHSDIMGGLDNWMEQRCPLASYGCGFSSRLLTPSSRKGTEGEDEAFSTSIVFVPDVDSFGRTVTFGISSSKEKGRAQMIESKNTISKFTAISTPRKDLLDLPNELLYTILDYLDPFW